MLGILTYYSIAPTPARHRRRDSALDVGCGRGSGANRQVVHHLKRGSVHLDIESMHNG